MIDGLGVGEIAKNLFGGFDDNILTLRHGVPRFDWPGASGPQAGKKGVGAIYSLRRMMRKSHPPDKRRCRHACLPGQHEVPIPLNGVSHFAPWYGRARAKSKNSPPNNKRKRCRRMVCA